MPFNNSKCRFVVLDVYEKNYLRVGQNSKSFKTLNHIIDQYDDLIIGKSEFYNRAIKLGQAEEVITLNSKSDILNLKTTHPEMFI